MNMNPANAMTVLVDATIAAAVMILKSKHIEIDAERLTADLRSTMRAEIGNILQEWKDAIDADLNEEWLRLMMNTQAITLALKALKSGGWF